MAQRRRGGAGTEVACARPFHQRRRPNRTPVTRGQRPNPPPLRLRTMKDTTGKNRPNRRRRPAGEDPEMRVVGIDVKPAPDAQERLRRLFTILVELAQDDLPPPGADPSPDDDDEEER